MLDKLAGLFMRLAVPLDKNMLLPLDLTATSSSVYAGIQNIHGRGATNGAGINLVIINEDMVEIIKSIKLLEDLGSIVDRISETVKNEIKD